VSRLVSLGGRGRNRIVPGGAAVEVRLTVVMEGICSGEAVGNTRSCLGLCCRAAGRCGALTASPGVHYDRRNHPATTTPPPNAPCSTNSSAACTTTRKPGKHYNEHTAFPTSENNPTNAAASHLDCVGCLHRLQELSGDHGPTRSRAGGGLTSIGASVSATGGDPAGLTPPSEHPRRESGRVGICCVAAGPATAA
jgi:hypothetical protein